MDWILDWLLANRGWLIFGLIVIIGLGFCVRQEGEEEHPNS